jgi:hypothetical protein
MREKLLALLEPFIQTIVTERLTAFHRGMVERGEIAPIVAADALLAVEVEPADQSDAGCSAAGCMSQSGLSLRPSGVPLH